MLRMDDVFPNKGLFSIGLFSLVLILPGCSDDQDVTDLKQYIQTIKARPKGDIDPLPEIKIVEPFIFDPEGLRNPFRPAKRKVEPSRFDPVTGSGIKPNTNRRKEELEAYSLSDLKMVGTVKMEGVLWGLVNATDGTIRRVKKGNHMGHDYGEIIRILEDKIELMEIVPDQPGTWREQQASLTLAE